MVEQEGKDHEQGKRKDLYELPKRPAHALSEDHAPSHFMMQDEGNALSFPPAERTTLDSGVCVSPC